MEAEQADGSRDRKLEEVGGTDERRGTCNAMLTWILSRLFPRRREMVQAEFAELLELMEKARAATSTAEVESVEREIDKLGSELINLCASTIR